MSSGKHPDALLMLPVLGNVIEFRLRVCLVFLINEMEL